MIHTFFHQYCIILIKCNQKTQQDMTHSNQHLHIHQPLDEKAIHNKLIAVKANCDTQGIRFTALREQVYRLILQAGKPIGAYDLLAKLQQMSDKTIAPPTVYRSLDFLLDNGFIHQLNSTKAFFACCQPDGQHVAAFLICQECGDVQEFSHHPIDTMLTHVAEQASFAIQSSVIELSGICQSCQINHSHHH